MFDDLTMNTILITSKMDIMFDDLTMIVNPSSKFTLRDILRAAVKSNEIPVEIMKRILRCKNLKDLYNEAEHNTFQGKGDIEYLEVYWKGHKDQWDNKIECGSQWGFHGIGKLGVVPDEKENPIKPSLKAKYRQKYAVELSPLYTLADYPIKICSTMSIDDWVAFRKSKNKKKRAEPKFITVDFQPCITLLELMSAIFWELSWFGSIKNRDAKKTELERRCKEIDEAKKNGTLDKLMIPWEEVKARIEKKLKKSLDNKELK